MNTTTQRPTPETDASDTIPYMDGDELTWWVKKDFARKLERERDELAAKLVANESYQAGLLAERDESREQLEAMREAIREAWVEMQYAEARFARWALRLASNDPDTDSVLHKTGEAICKLQPFLKP